MDDQQILVSIIVPVYNARDYLERSLSAIRKSDYLHFELIVVDDCSTDGSSELAAKYADIVLKTETRVAPGKARNKGVSASSGEILFFVDADVVVAPESIFKVAQAMKADQEIVAIFGSYDDRPTSQDFFSQYKNLLHHFVHQNSNPHARTFWAGCGAIRKKAFLKENGFTTRYSSASIEDVEIGYKLKARGNKISLLKQLQVTHLKKWNLITLLRSDILHRAIPWTRLSYEKGLPFDLNFKLSDRISGVIACIFFLSLILIWRWNGLLFFSLLFAGIIFYLNRKLYSLFLKKRGIWFTIRAIFFHWFYYLYSSLTFIIFSIYFSLRGLPRRIDAKR